MLIGATYQRYMPSAKVSHNTCLSHSRDYDGVFPISERYSSSPRAGHIAEGHIITRNDGR
jgi:hypothetical protein